MVVLSVEHVLQRPFDYDGLGDVSVHAGQLALKPLPGSPDSSKEIIQRLALYGEKWITFERIVTGVKLAPSRYGGFFSEVPT